MNWYLKVLKQYADFNGRARRKEYWMFALFNFIFTIVAIILDYALGLTVGELPYGVIYFLYTLAVFIPSLAAVVRRLHDVGKSGWMIFWFKCNRLNRFTKLLRNRWSTLNSNSVN